MHSCSILDHNCYPVSQFLTTLKWPKQLRQEEKDLCYGCVESPLPPKKYIKELKLLKYLVQNLSGTLVPEMNHDPERLFDDFTQQGVETVSLM